MTALRALGALLLSSQLLSGCSSNGADTLASFTPSAPIQLAPKAEVGTAKVPIAVGDIVVYNNPTEQWRVSSITQQTIAWQSTNGASKLSTLSPLLPNLRWFSGNNSYLSGTRTLSQLTGQLHPVAVGNQYSFTLTERHNGHALAQHAHWQCEATGAVPITVPAGSSDTIEVVCKVNGQERLLMNYAPELGHVVRHVFVLENGDRAERQLTGFARAGQ